MSEMNPCPFCGSSDIQIRQQMRDPGYYRVQCMNGDCCALMEDVNSPANAAYLWNHRPAEDQLVEEIQERVAMLDAAHEIRKGQTETNAALRKRVEELEGLVETAYKEGINEGEDYFGPRLAQEMWMESDAYETLKALTAQEAGE